VCFKSESGDDFVADVPNKMSPNGEMSMKTRTGSTKHKNVHKFAAERVLAASNKKEEELVHGQNLARSYLKN